MKHFLRFAFEHKCCAVNMNLQWECINNADNVIEREWQERTLLTHFARLIFTIKASESSLQSLLRFSFPRRRSWRKQITFKEIKFERQTWNLKRKDRKLLQTIEKMLMMSPPPSLHANVKHFHKFWMKSHHMKYSQSLITIWQSLTRFSCLDYLFKAHRIRPPVHSFTWNWLVGSATDADVCDYTKRISMSTRKLSARSRESH